MVVKIYVLKDPISEEIRYIGRTKNSLAVRLSGHCSKAKRNSFKTHKDNWILKLTEKPIIEQIEEVLGWEESYIREQEIIKEYISNGYRLTNLHDRGTGGLLRDISIEQRQKISATVKKLHAEGKFSCNKKSVDLYDLKGNFIITLDSYKNGAEYIGIPQKHFQNSMKRNAKRIKNFQVVRQNSPHPGIWKQRTGEITKNFKKLYLWDTLDKVIIELEARKRFTEMFDRAGSTINHYLDTNKLFNNRYLITNARVKLDELLENLEIDNQQPS